jgi:hypothetical protein
MATDVPGAADDEETVQAGYSPILDFALLEWS